MAINKAVSIDTAFQAMMKGLQARSRSWETEQAESEEKVEYECSECKDRGVQKKIAKLMAASGITEKFEKLLFGNFKLDGKPQMIKDAYECAVEYFKDFEKIKGERANSIALLGQPGSGKTHLLTAIMNNLIKKKSTHCLYFPYVEGMSDLKKDFDQLETKLNAMRKADVLFIDDLFKPVDGKPRATEWQVCELSLSEP